MDSKLLRKKSSDGIDVDVKNFIVYQKTENSVVVSTGNVRKKSRKQLLYTKIRFC